MSDQTPGPKADKTSAAKPDTPKPSSAKSGTAKASEAKSGSAKSSSAKSSAAKASAAKPTSAKSRTTKASAAKADAAKTAPPKADADTSDQPVKQTWTNRFLAKHAHVERNASLLLVLSLVVVSVGGLVEIAPLFYIENTIEEVDGMRPYSPLELTGREIYVREGCYVCHSQMVRPMRDEVDRYGHYSLAAESMYDHPFQWGSKRTGPDLARVGGRYSDAWHVDHMTDPQSVVPESIMPKYAFLADTQANGRYVSDLLRTHRAVGVPYTDEMIASATADFYDQADADSDWDGLLERYPKAQVRNFDNAPGVSEMDALIAYLQMLGTLVDFSTFTPDPNR